MLPDVVGIVLSIAVAVFATWPAWCLTYHVGAGAALAWLLMRAKADVVGVTA